MYKNPLGAHCCKKKTNKTQAEEGEATGARFVSVLTSSLQSAGPQPLPREAARFQLPAKPTAAPRTTHPTGCWGPAATTNNGTTSVLLGVAVGSGKQEVVLK